MFTMNGMCPFMNHKILLKQRPVVAFAIVSKAFRRILQCCDFLAKRQSYLCVNTRDYDKSSYQNVTFDGIDSFVIGFWARVFRSLYRFMFFGTNQLTQLQIYYLSLNFFFSHSK